MVNLVIAAMAERINGSPTYAWKITEDRVSEGADLGVTGPGNAPEELLARDVDGGWDFVDPADARRQWTFRMYDDDGEHYYTGKLVTLEASPDADETGPAGALCAPLYDFGEGNAGCTRIAWEGHPEWDVS